MMKISVGRCITFGLGLTLAGVTPAVAQHAETPVAVPRYRARILGIYDDATGAPLGDVKVSDIVAGTSAMTTATGTVSLVFLPDGGSFVRLQKLGYETQTFPIRIAAGDTVPVTVTMKSAVQLSKMVTTADSARRYISPALNGFLERKQAGIGYFVDDSALRKNENQRLADLLRSRLPSFFIVESVSPNGSILLLRAPRCMVGGPPDVYLDGVPVDPPPPKRARPVPNDGKAHTASEPGPSPFDISQFNVADLTGVEWYPDSDLLPAQYARASDRCGALLLWTREK